MRIYLNCYVSKNNWLTVCLIYSSLIIGMKRTEVTRDKATGGNGIKKKVFEF